ncbi:MAG: restriction endonuclease [Acidobacteriaceae bacterium]
MAETFHFAGPLPPSPFIGRERELDWLRSRLGRARRSVADDFLWIVGEAGIGKTALLAQFLEHYTEERSVVWFNCAEWAKETPDFRSVFDGLSELSRIIVVFDGAEAVSEVKLVQLYMAARNRKAVETVIFTSRLEVKLRGRHEQLVLTRMPEFDAEALLRAKLRLNDLDETSALRLAAVVNGNPEAMSIVAAMAQSMSSDQLRRVLSGKIYDADEALEQDGRRIASSAKPLVINASQEIAKRLKQEPKDIHKLTPRQYEELIAELLRDMGHEVSLTKATRDGGKDILASMKTDIGEILCLVDTKKYRRDRKIGVGMVRTLYGTLADYQATSAMLVTTSSYSPDARAMQEKHKYQLSLKDYTDVAVWIQKYGTKV